MIRPTSPAVVYLCVTATDLRKQAASVNQRKKCLFREITAVVGFTWPGNLSYRNRSCRKPMASTIDSARDFVRLFLAVRSLRSSRPQLINTTHYRLSPREG